MSEQPASILRLPLSTLLLGAGGVLLVLGALLPWVTVGSILSISGITARWGLLTIIAGVVVLLAASGAGRGFAARQAHSVALVAAVAGAASLLIALYVGFAIRDAVAESREGSQTVGVVAPSGLDPEFQRSFDELSASLLEAFKASTGVGVYATALGGALACVGYALALRRT